MCNYNNLPYSERLKVDMITANANIMRDAINESDKTPQEKGDEIELLHDNVKDMLCRILINN